MTQSDLINVEIYDFNNPVPKQQRITFEQCAELLTEPCSGFYFGKTTGQQTFSAITVTYKCSRPPFCPFKHIRADNPSKGTYTFLIPFRLPADRDGIPDGCKDEFLDAAVAHISGTPECTPVLEREQSMTRVYPSQNITRAFDLPLFDPTVSGNEIISGLYQDRPDPIAEQGDADREAEIERAAQQYERAMFEQSVQPMAVFCKNEFRRKIAQNRIAVPTGFANFDNYNRGGLHNGLYCITAGTSVGKTDFCLQMADRIAAGTDGTDGADVLYFSLEMTRESLLARSLSRIHAAMHQDTILTPAFNGSSDIKTDRSIDDGAFLRGETDAPDIERYYTEHQGVRLRVIEGIMNTTADDVVDAVWHFAVNQQYTDKRHSPRKPEKRPFVVFVDYFQDLQPPIPDDPRAPKDPEAPIKPKFITDRQAASYAVQQLYKLSKELCIPVVVISATARSGYREEQTIASAKESGMIEYAADAVFGLQYHVVSMPEYRAAGDTPKQNSKTKADLYREAQRQYPRQMELTLQKNRFTGDDPVSFSFSYCPNIHTYRDEGLNHWKDSDSSSEANTQTNAAAAFGKQNGAEKNSSKYRSGRAH